MVMWGAVGLGLLLFRPAWNLGQCSQALAADHLEASLSVAKHLLLQGCCSAEAKVLHWVAVDIAVLSFPAAADFPIEGSAPAAEQRCCPAAESCTVVC